MIKSENPGEDASGDDRSGGGSRPAPFNLGDGSGRISVDTDQLNRGAAGFESAADRFRHYANSNRELASYAPLPSGEGDESWNAFAPKYYKRSEEYLNGLAGLAKAMGIITTSVKQFRVFCVGTEANATDISLKLKDAMGPGNVPGQQPDGDGRR
ncbi:hypothetical protein [Lentzea sp. HUAS12]|uniref:hypothetical protein n=1 Tax=Lentzea sp. HUAS12 TaxID=2951806 RepID=UPI00209F633A|nr:hypothetical protein [Lentzea sp. HUAS12]USX55516.1 hypothetical protein ND450_15865 [Lentzea sp. HUAS12]